MTQDLKIHISADGIATVTSQLNQVNSSIQNVEKSGGFTSFRNGLAMTGLAIDAVVTNAKRLAGVGNYFIDPAAEIEQLKLRLESLYGSFDAGAKAFQTFQDVAAKTPSSLIEVVNAGASLKAFGVDAEKMIAPITDLAAYMGVDVVEAAQSMGRAFAGGQGAADILRERGVLNLIKSFNGIDDLTKLTLPQFREAMEKTLVDPAGGIAGAADRMSKSYTGALSNMADIWSRVRASIVSDMTKSLEGGFRSITKSLEDFIASGAAEKMAKQIAQVTEAMLKVISIATRLDYVTVGIGAAFTAAAVMIYKYRLAQIAAFTQTGILTTATFSLSGAMTAAAASVRGFMAALGPVGLAITAVGLAVTGGYYAFNNYSASSKQLTDDLEILRQKLKETREETITLVGALPKTGNNEYINGMVSGFQKFVENQEKAKKATESAAKAQEEFNQALDDTNKKLNDIMSVELNPIKFDGINEILTAIADMNLSLLQASEAYYSATDNLSQRHIDLQIEIYRQEIQAKYGTALLSMQIDEMVANKRIELNKMATDSNADMNLSLLQASEAYYSATDNLSKKHIDLQLDIYRQEIQAKYGTALLSMQIDEMVANKRIELNKMATDSIKTENESALDKLVKDNEVASALMTNSVNTISSEFTRMFQIQTKSSNDAVRIFSSFVNAMIADIGRLIAKQLVSAALTKLIAAGGGSGGGSGGGIFSILGSIFGGKSTGGGNGLGNVVGASQSNQTLTMAINRLNYNLEGGMQNNVNVYVKPRDIARANTVGQMQLVTL